MVDCVYKIHILQLKMLFYNNLAGFFQYIYRDQDLKKKIDSNQIGVKDGFSLFVYFFFNLAAIYFSLIMTQFYLNFNLVIAFVVINSNISIKLQIKFKLLLL